jgi:hypothetical protein
MGERNSVFVFKGPTLEEFQTAFCEVVRQLGGRCVWDERPPAMKSLLLTSHKDRIHAAYIHWEEYKIASALGKRMKIPWINVRIQEGSLWDYSLYQGSEKLDNFSTMPEYWDSNPEFLANWRGNADVLANVWNIEKSRFENYMRPWYGGIDEDNCIVHNSELTGRAYPEDQFEFGDIWQMTDFLRALGAHDPNWDKPECVPRLLVPAKTRNSWWVGRWWGFA